MNFNEEVAKEVVFSVFREYPDEFDEVINNKPIKDAMLEKILAEYKRTDEMPNELEVWGAHEDLLIEASNARLQENASLINNSSFGLEFSNKDNTQFGVMINCMSGKIFKVAIFDQKGVFTHRSADSAIEIAKFLRELSVDGVNQNPQFEKLSETDDFINGTANLMDRNKSRRFSV